MNKKEQRKEIREIFEADVIPKDVKTKFNTMLNAVTVEVQHDLVVSYVIRNLFAHGYTSFNVAKRDYGLRLNIFYKETEGIRQVTLNNLKQEEK